MSYKIHAFGTPHAYAVWACPLFDLGSCIRPRGRVAARALAYRHHVPQLLDALVSVVHSVEMTLKVRWKMRRCHRCADFRLPPLWEGISNV